MKQKYFPPEYQAKKFHCALCSVFAAQYWHNLFMHTGNGSQRTPYTASLCAHCGEHSYWYESRMVVPSAAPVEQPHEQMPENCLPEYEEARDIFSRSPKGAAALLRLCLQKLMPHIGEQGKNINEDIASLVSKGLPMQVQQALDVCRVVGNNAVHPGEIQLDDTPEMAQQLFQMINFIVEERIARPLQIGELFSRLPATTRAAIERRDIKTLKGPQAQQEAQADELALGGSTA